MNRGTGAHGSGAPNGEAIRVSGLTKHYGTTRAVDGASFTVERGEIFSLLGPNGAGKTTTISILSCLARPTGGEAWIFGRSVAREPMAVKASIGLVPQEIALYPDLSAQENLLFWGRMQGLGGARLRRRAEEVLEIIGLADRRHARVAAYSGGMKRRVNIGIALMHEPALLILDEPTVGIDPAEPAPHPGQHQGAEPPRHDRAVHDPLHGGGAGAVAPHLHHGRGKGDRLRHARRAGEDGRRAGQGRADAQRGVRGRAGGLEGGGGRAGRERHRRQARPARAGRHHRAAPTVRVGRPRGGADPVRRRARAQPRGGVHAADGARPAGRGRP